MRKILLLSVLLFLFIISAKNIDPDQWTYIQVDSTRAKWGDFAEPEWLRYFGLDFADVNFDGEIDIISGRYVYLNHGGNMESSWERIDFGLNADGMVAINIDNDNCADVIAQALPDVYWLEAEDKTGKSWEAKKIATLPKTGHVNGQGYGAADIFKGGKPEIILAAEGGFYSIMIHKDMTRPNWEVTHIVESKSSEGFGCKDIDGDGDLDLVAGDAGGEDGEHANVLSWYENPGQVKENWKAHFIGNTVNAIDRVEAADLNGDGKMDVAVAEEQFPPEGPTAYLFWYE